MSYSNKLIKFTLVHYTDIMTGSISGATFDEMKLFTKSSGKKNPQETLSIWKADIDTAICSLAPRHDIWQFVSTQITPSMLLHISRSRGLSLRQRDIVSLCILADCGRVCSGYCSYVEGTISMMRRFLNVEKNRTDLKNKKESPFGLSLVG